MRNVKYWALAACILLAPTAIAQQWFAWEWNTSPGTAWDYNGFARTITIVQPGTYRFFGTLDSRTGPLADIQNVTAPGVNGAVTVSIIREGGQHLPGCTELGALDLSGATSSTVAELRVAGNAATQAGITFGTLADGDTFNVTGGVTHRVTVTADLNGDVTCAALGDFEATTVVGGAPIITVTSDYAGTMEINGTGSVGGLTLGGLSGSVVCHPNIGAGGVTINGSVSGTLHLIGVSNSSGGAVTISGDIVAGGTVFAEKPVDTSLTVLGNLAGTLDVQGDVTGSTRVLRVQEDVASTGMLYVGQPTTGQVFASIRVDGDMLGAIRVRRILTSTAGAPYGHVRVNGALGAPDQPAEIWLQGGMSAITPACVCINYDGFGRDNFPELDVWHDGSTVKLDSTTYTEPDDEARVHAAPPSCGKGDCDGSGEVDFFDIDPFVALIGFDPAAYPGRAPAVLLMADADCDLDVDFFDIDPFVALLGGGCGDPCNTALGGEPLMMAGVVAGIDSASLAAVLNEHVSDANRATLLAGIEQLAQTPPAGTPIDWPAVYEALTGN